MQSCNRKSGTVSGDKTPTIFFFLFKRHPLDSPDNGAKILAAILAKSASRGLKVDRMSMRQEEIERRSREEYPLLAQEVPETLPDFHEVYSLVRDFYESLPWANPTKHRSGE